MCRHQKSSPGKKNKIYVVKVYSTCCALSRDHKLCHNFKHITITTWNITLLQTGSGGEKRTSYHAYVQKPTQKALETRCSWFHFQRTSYSLWQQSKAWIKKEEGWKRNKREAVRKKSNTHVFWMCGSTDMEKFSDLCFQIGKHSTLHVMLPYIHLWKNAESVKSDEAEMKSSPTTRFRSLHPQLDWAVHKWKSIFLSFDASVNLAVSKKPP